jgi:hypothetical protein
MTSLERVCDVLDHHHIRYALIGAAAMAVYGVSRSTFDIDLLTTDHRALDRTIWAALAGDADVRRGDPEDPLAGVVRITIGEERPIDIVIGRHAWQARAVERAQQMGDAVPVVLARDLVLLKLYAGGSQDLWDVRELLQHAGTSVASEVAADVERLSPDLQQRWKSVQP